MTRFCFILLLCAVGCASMQAQTPTVTPTALQFTASADQSTVVSGTSTPVLTSYTVSVFQGTTLAMSQTLGKPAPDGTNTIVVPLSTIAGFSTLTKNVVFTATVQAVGPAGTTTSGPSNPFVFAPAPAAPANVSVH